VLKSCTPIRARENASCHAEDAKHNRSCEQCTKAVTRNGVVKALIAAYAQPVKWDIGEGHSKKRSMPQVQLPGAFQSNSRNSETQKPDSEDSGCSTIP
jgi:hypothetical protein